MKIASNKNYPSFNLKDTFIYSKDFTSSPDMTSSFLYPFSPFLLTKKKQTLPLLTPTPKKKILSISSNFPTQTDEKCEKSKVMKKMPNSFRPYLISNISNDKINFSKEFNPKEIVEYLNFLGTTQSTKKDLFSNIRLRRKLTLRSLDLSKDFHPKNTNQKGYLGVSPQINNNKNSKSKNSEEISQANFDQIKKTGLKISETIQETSHRSSGDSLILKNQSPIKNLGRRSIVKPPSRFESIPEYPKLLEVIRKIVLNFREINEKNENKLLIIPILNSLIPPKKRYLEKLFFIGEKLNPIITEKSLESSCIIQEKQLGVGLKERLLKPGLIKDLEELNAELEEHNLKKEAVEIKFLEDKVKDSFNSITKLKSKEFWLSNVDFLNYEKIKQNTIIDDLIECEKNLGRFECITTKQKTVGKLLDQTIKNLRKENKREELELKYMQESYKLV